MKLSEFWLVKEQDESSGGYVPTKLFVSYEPLPPEFVMAGIRTCLSCAVLCMVVLVTYFPMYFKYSSCFLLGEKIKVF